MPEHPLADAVGLWPINSLGNKLFDLSGNNKNVALTNTTWGRDKYGYAIEVNASGEYGTLINSSPAVVDSEKGTIVLYFKSNLVFNDGSIHFLFGSRGAGNTVGDFWLTKWSSNVLYFHLTDAVAAHYINFDSTHFPNWQTGHQITVQWDRNNAIWNSDNLVLLVDGVYRTPTGQGNETGWNSFTVDTPLGILNDAENTSRDADGLLSYLDNYKEVLSQSAIRDIYRNPFCMFPEHIMPEFGVAA